MTDPPVEWQVKVTPRDRGNLGVVKQRLESGGLRSVRRRRSVLLGARTAEEGEETARRVRELPMPPIDVKVERVSRVWATLHAWFQGSSEWRDVGGAGGGDGGTAA